MHGVGVLAFHEVRCPAVPAEQISQFVARDARQDRWIIDLVAVQVKDGQYGAIAYRAQELAGVPGSGQRTGLRLAVGTETIANITLQVMGNLVDGDTPGAAGRVFSLTDRALALADPLLRRTRAAA